MDLRAPEPSERHDDPRLMRARAALGDVFGLREFRPWQWETIESLLVGRGRALLVAPTGGGKSLTYQLPATVLDGMTLVVSPLVALMEDQVRSLVARGISATYLSATLDAEERRRREEGLSAGEYKLVFVAPERLASGAFLARLARAQVDLVAVDEAHCIAQWGHDFRPDYLRVGDLLGMLSPSRVLACTATATPLVRKEIASRLGFTDYDEVLRGFARPNLHLRARTIDGPKEARERVLGALRDALSGPRSPKGAAIVYAATRKSAERWNELLVGEGYTSAAYHAGLEGETRAKVSAAFSSGRLAVVVATNAFGMGIDRPDIRCVVHAQPPTSVEAYYQEVGRAGRDGDEAHGLLLCSSADIAVRRRLVALDPSGEGDAEAARRAWAQFREVLTYIDAGSCRHDFILRYFGDEGETLGGCGHCDVCERLDAGEGEALAREEADLVMKKALSGVARAKQRAGLGAIVSMLVGHDDARVQRFGFHDLSTFGLFRGEDPAWVLSVLRVGLAAGFLDLTPTEHPVPFITREGWDALRAKEPLRVVVPARDTAQRRGRSGGTARKPPRTVEIADDDRTTFERLRALRSELARGKNVPAYVVAKDTTLAEIAKRRPSSLAELGLVDGFGPSRLDAYGESFLRALREA